LVATGREQLREQLLQHVKLAERELSETQRAARIEAGYQRAASQRSELERQLLELRWQLQEARADREMAQGEAQAVAKRLKANQRAQETLLLQAIGFESRAASAHERAEQLRLGVAAQRSRNTALVQDLSVLAQPMGANTYLRRKLQELQGDLISQLAHHRRDHHQLKRASSRQLMEHAGLTGHQAADSPAALGGGAQAGVGSPMATSSLYSYRADSAVDSGFDGVSEAGQAQQHSAAYR
jgi:hypothetical protein